jgi:hypothetical protein
MRLSLPKLRLRYADISPNPFRDEPSIISLYRKVMAIGGRPQDGGGGRGKAIKTSVKGAQKSYSSSIVRDLILSYGLLQELYSSKIIYDLLRSYGSDPETLRLPAEMAAET